MEVTIMITNTVCKVVTPLNIDQLAVLSSVCSFEVDRSDYIVNTYRKKGAKWDGYRKLFNIQTRRFPIGLLPLITKTLNMYGISVKYDNKRTYIESDYSMYKASNFRSRAYQDTTVLKSVVDGNGIIKSATGSGKTTMAARTIAALGKKAIFVVHTRDLLYQTIESFHNILGTKIGWVGDGVIDYQDVTVATMQTLAILGDIKYESYKYDEDKDGEAEEKIKADKLRMEQFKQYAETVGVVMFDEVQRICSQTAFSTRFLFPNANNAFGYSASPWRDDGSDLMIEAAFGPRICDITASELIELGYLVQPYIKIKKVKSPHWKGTSYPQIYESAITQNMPRNLQVAHDALEQYNLGRNTLVLVTMIKHGEILEQIMNELGMPAIFISGKSRMKKRRQVIDDMRSGKAQIVIASTIADVGLDVPRLQSIVEAGAGKSSVTALQRLGRIMRPFPGKDRCYFVTYRDTAPYLSSQIDKKIEIWRTEPYFIIEQE